MKLSASENYRNRTRTLSSKTRPGAFGCRVLNYLVYFGNLSSVPFAYLHNLAKKTDSNRVLMLRFGGI
jgi:hypothetical protein